MTNPIPSDGCISGMYYLKPEKAAYDEAARSEGMSRNRYIKWLAEIGARQVNPALADRIRKIRETRYENVLAFGLGLAFSVSAFTGDSDHVRRQSQRFSRGRVMVQRSFPGLGNG